MQLKYDKNPQAGFTMIELSIVTLIFALVTLPLLNLYSGYVHAQKRAVTVERIETISAQVRLYRPSTFSYPCPADATLSINDANYGFEDCAAIAINTCNPTGGICRVSGNRDTDTPADGMNNDSVLIGAVPFRSMDLVNQGGIGVDGSVDGWGNKMTYAVIARATNYFPGRNALSVGNDFKYGQITALDEFGNNTAGIGMFDLDNADGDGNPLTGTKEGDAQFAIISHGPTGAGARSINGVLIPCVAGTIDNENCDGDATFRSALGDYSANGATFYDDLSFFYKDQTGELWGYLENPNVGGATAHIRKLNNGKVGVSTGNATVAEALEINGAVKTPTTLVQEICKTNGTNCIPTRYLYDSLPEQFPTTINTTSDTNTKNWSNTCRDFGDGTGQAMTQISNGRAVCANSVNIPASITGADIDCPLGTYVQGITTKGCIICSNGLPYPSAAACDY